MIGAVANPLYSLLIAHTNDFLDHSDMAAASGGLLFINGLGSMTGPLAHRRADDAVWPGRVLHLYRQRCLALIALYAAYRATQRPSPAVDSTSSYAPVAPQCSPVALELAQEVAIERAEGAAAV